MNDPYQVLGVPETATDAEVRKAYLNLARKYHPDNYHDSPLADLAQEKMKEINAAYEQITKERSGRSSASSGGSTGYGSSYDGSGYGSSYGGYSGAGYGGYGQQYGRSASGRASIRLKASRKNSLRCAGIFSVGSCGSFGMTSTSRGSKVRQCRVEAAMNPASRSARLLRSGVSVR